MTDEEIEAMAYKYIKFSFDEIASEEWSEESQKAYSGYVWGAKAVRDKMLEREQIAIEALEFYGNRDSYDTTKRWSKTEVVESDCEFMKCTVNGKNQSTGGRRAREALAKLKATK